RSRRPSAVFAQSSIAWAIDSIANPHLNADPGTIIAFPGEIFGLTAYQACRWHAHRTPPGPLNR
ncbi:hypothetical protein, partial [Thiolapillus sp.]